MCLQGKIVRGYEEDKVVCTLMKSGKFMVQSIRNVLEVGSSVSFQREYLEPIGATLILLCLGDNMKISFNSRSSLQKRLSL